MKNKKIVSFGCVFASGLLWAFTGIFVKFFQNSGLDSAAIAGLRVFAATISLVVTIFIYDKSLFKIKFKDIWCFACAGLLSLLLQTFCYFKSIEYTSSIAVSAILLYTAPVFVIIMSKIFFKENLTLEKCLAVIVAIIGCGFVTELFGAPQEMSVPGVLFGIAAGFFYGTFSIFGKVAINKGYKSLTITLYTFIFGSIGAVPMMLLMGSDVGKTASFVFTSGLPGIGCMFGMGIIGAAAPYMLYTTGLKEIDESIASVTASVEPVAAAVYGVIFYGETLSSIELIGIVLVMTAIIIGSGVVKVRRLQRRL